MDSKRKVATNIDEKLEPKLKKLKLSIRAKLEEASKMGNIEIVKHCLKTYFDLHERNESGMTLLHIASESGHAEIVAEFLKHGANVDQKNKSGYTALHLASKKGHLKVVAILLASGAKIDLHVGLSPEGCNGCHHLSGDFCYPNGNALYMASKYGHVNVVKILLNHGASIKTSRCSISSLQIACEYGQIEIVKELLKNGANINIQDHEAYDNPPLHMAVCHGKIELVQELVKLGADVNLFDSYYGSPINVAARDGNLTLVKELLNLGADPYQYLGKGDDDYLDMSETTPLDGAATKLQELVLDDAETKEHQLVVEEILLHHKNDAIVNNKNQTPLHFATKFEEAGVVKKLLLRGCNVNVKTTDNETPLHYAIESAMTYDRGLSVLSLLLKHGADVNAQDDYGDTPLHIALKENHELYTVDKNFQLQLLKTMLEEGSNIDFNVKDANGQTALQVAIDEKDADFVNVLLRYGAPLKVRNEDGNIPLEWTLSKDSSMKHDFIKVFAFHQHNSNM